jgi:RND superfamily putative drug exporter
MSAVARFVLRHRLAVMVFWLSVLAAGFAASSALSSRLSQQVALPGVASYRANQEIHRLYGNGGDGYVEVVVVRLPAVETVASSSGRRALATAFERLRSMRGLRAADYANTADPGFLTSDPDLTYGLVFTPYAAEQAHRLAGPITAAMTPALPPGSLVRVTGMTELKSGGSAQQGQGVLAETLVAGAAAVAVLTFVFGSALALAPLLMAVVAIPATFLAVFGLTEITSIFFIVQYLVALIGLGISIDYSLLLVTRWREEMVTSHSSAEAVQRAMATAGRSIGFSGLTVALGLLMLIVLPVPLVRSIGPGSMLIPLVSVAVSLSLLPVLLATIGPRIDRPRPVRAGQPSRAWTAWAHCVTRHPWLGAFAALAILAGLGAAATGINIGEPTAASLAGPKSPAAQTFRSLERAGVPAGVLEPIEALVPASAHPSNLAHRLAELPGVRTAVAPDAPEWRRDRTALISVQPVAQPSTSAGAATIAAVRHTTKTIAGVQVGGPGALVLDENHAFYREVPLLIALLAIIAIVLLVRAFGSVLLPIKAVVLNLISIGATYGVIVLIWQDGHGSKTLWGLPATGAITNWVPLVVFAFLYGLSMDYEVFIVTRIREERDRTGSTTDGIIQGIGRTGRLVTGAALCLFFALAALTTTPDTDVRVLATALAAGILLDATVVRGLLVPALVALFGRWNWWTPRWITAPALQNGRSQRDQNEPVSQASDRP